jgi:type III pantothenate kinase
MVLVDIGNTNIHIWDNGKIYDSKEIVSLKDKVFYISVNKEKEKEFLKRNPKAVNLKNYVTFNTKYLGLGIDRIMACKSIKDGVVVDAGSAITIDVMEEGYHKGGIIMPGMYAFKKAFGTISEILKFNTEIIKTDKFPNSTQEALNYGSVGAVKCVIENMAKNKQIFFYGRRWKIFCKNV